MKHMEIISIELLTIQMGRHELSIFSSLFGDSINKMPMLMERAT